ncbi:kinase-like protein [Thelephora ganbajun]|uniref:Kinase-like protein n=1 Tax=Thelephora ganbajun TaxID=370292 RepID=A0ACB6ZRG8_THEGA|nr:kinase-like protein [Thelephora ganbajun]
MRFVKQKDTEAGIVGLIEKLKSIIALYPAIQPTLVSSPRSQEVNPPSRGSLEGNPPRERIGENTPPIVTGTGHNGLGFHEPLLLRTTKPGTQESQLVETDEAPPVKRLDGEVTKLGDIAFAGGTHCEVWIGRWEKGGGKKVALKALRTLKSPERARKRLEQELPSWTELHHQNILPFYGIVTDLGPRPYMVSPWRENGNLLVYVKKNRKSNKNYLLRGSAAGLSYLHSRDIVHGSVKCKNVLISREGEPQICDFGIARIVEEINESTISKTVSSGDVVRYSAPELIENNNVFATTYSDTYSFAMLILECITEEKPFSNLSRDATVIHARISKRQCPPRPDADRKDLFSDGLWDLMTRCWAVKPDQRPPMEQIHSFFLDQA